MNSERNTSSADPSSWGALVTVVDEPEVGLSSPAQMELVLMKLVTGQQYDLQ